MITINILTEDSVIDDSKSIEEIGIEDVSQESVSISDLLIIVKGEEFKVLKERCFEKAEIFPFDHLAGYIKNYLEEEDARRKSRT